MRLTPSEIEDEHALLEVRSYVVEGDPCLNKHLAQNLQASEVVFCHHVRKHSILRCTTQS